MELLLFLNDFLLYDILFRLFYDFKLRNNDVIFILC